MEVYACGQTMLNMYLDNGWILDSGFMFLLGVSPFYMCNRLYCVYFAPAPSTPQATRIAMDCHSCVVCLFLLLLVTFYLHLAWRNRQEPIFISAPTLFPKNVHATEICLRVCPHLYPKLANSLASLDCTNIRLV
jgi:hypothetical protein